MHLFPSRRKQRPLAAAFPSLVGDTALPGDRGGYTKVLGRSPPRR